MKNPLVSIVMVNYNKEQFLREAVESVIAQTYRNWELIIVDDGSTDNSAEILKGYKDERIRLYFLEENRHICYATNYGLERVRGEYVARLDSDDVWRADKLEKQIEFFRNTPEAEICFTKLDIIDGNGEIVNEKEAALYRMYNERQKNRAEWVRFFFYVGNSLIQSTLMLKTSLLREVGYFNFSYMQAHDFDFFVRLIKKSDFYFIEEPLVRYRRVESQNSAYHPENDRRFFNEHMNIRMHFFEEFPDELFLAAFQPDFVNPASHSPEEFVCEQAFLLCRCIGRSEFNPVLGMLALERLLRDAGYRRLLEEKYQFTLKDYYRLNGKAQFYSVALEEQIDAMLGEQKEQEEHIRVLLELKDMQQRHIENMQNSFSWKVTKPLRKIKKMLLKG